MYCGNDPLNFVDPWGLEPKGGYLEFLGGDIYDISRWIWHSPGIEVTGKRNIGPWENVDNYHPFDDCLQITLTDDICRQEEGEFYGLPAKNRRFPIEVKGGTVGKKGGNRPPGKGGFDPGAAGHAAFNIITGPGAGQMIDILTRNPLGAILSTPVGLLAALPGGVSEREAWSIMGSISLQFGGLFGYISIAGAPETHGASLLVGLTPTFANLGFAWYCGRQLYYDYKAENQAPDAITY